MTRYKCIKRLGVKYEVHRLQVETAIGRKLSFNEVVHHKNGNKLDNRPENLEIMTRAEHSRLHSLGKKMSNAVREKLRTSMKNYWTNGKSPSDKPIIQLTKDGRFIREFRSIRHAARELGFTNPNICKCCKGRLKTYRGFIFRYK